MGSRKQTRNSVQTKNARTQPVALSLPTMTSVPFSRKDYIAAALTWLMPFVVYVHMIGPAVTGEDCGELVAAAYTLGIPHPPGYPLWSMLGKLFTFLPVGSIAWRVSLMSAFFGAAAAALICLLVIRLTRNRVAAVAAGLFVAFSQEFWSQCTVAEVYPLNAFFVAACLLILVVWQESRKTSLLYLFALTLGLGMCHHNTMNFLGPPFALFIMVIHRRPWQQWKTYGFMLIIAFGVWILVHLYLPIRSMANPPMDWGNPETWDNFWHVVLRRQYSLGFTTKPHSVARFLQQIGEFLSMYRSQFTLGFAALPLLGIYPLWKLNRARCVLIVGAFFYIVIGFILVLNFDFDTESLLVNRTFFIPAHMMAAVLMGVAIHGFAQLKLGRVKLAAPALALCIALPVIPFLTNYDENDKSNYYYAYDFAANLLRTLDENAVYFADRDHAAFPVVYLQVVEKQRPDVTIANKHTVIDHRLYEDMPLPIRAKLSDPLTDQDNIFIQDWIVANSGRTVYSMVKRQIQNVSGFEMANAGLLFKIIGANTPPRQSDYWAQYEWRNPMDDLSISRNFTASNVAFDYHYALARDLFEKHAPEKALEELAFAARFGFDSKDKMNNIASMCGEFDQLEASKDYFSKALALDPNHRVALRNLAKVQWGLSDFDGVVKSLDHLIELDAKTFGANNRFVGSYLNDRGIALLALRNADQARQSFDRALKIDENTLGRDHPNVARDMNNIAVLLRAQGDMQEAQRFSKRALEIFTNKLGPNHPTTQLAQNGEFIRSTGD